MKKYEHTGFNFSSVNLIHYALSHWKPLMLVSSLAIIVSMAVSLIITPLFKSSMVLFPASSVSVSEELVGTTGPGSRSGILSFGEEQETEQLLQILNSDDIKDKLIAKFHLFEHYKIDPSSPTKYTLLYNKMKKLISFKKTQYMSVRIDVLDKDPQMAANITNEIAALLDSTINRMRKQRAREAFKIVSAEYIQLQSEIKELEDSLKSIGRLGIYDVEAQSQGLNEAWIQAVVSGNVQQAKKLEQQIQVLGEYGSNYLFLKEFLKNESDRLSLLRDKFTRAKVDLKQTLPNAFIVSKARVAEKKSYPKRSYIVILSTISAFLFTFFTLIVSDTFRKNA